MSVAPYRLSGNLRFLNHDAVPLTGPAGSGGSNKDDEMHDFEHEQAAVDQLVGLPVADVERDLILATLRETGGNRTHAAHLLGIAIRTLRNKINLYAADGHEIPEPPQGSVA
jgi:DNA-binding NtrC family response regulator